MRFALTAEQQDLRKGVRELVDRIGRPAPLEPAPALAALTGLGAWGLLAAEEHGGLGLDENHLVPVLTELGGAAMPLPLTETIAVAPGVLAEAELGEAAGTCCAADPSARGIVRHALTAGRLLRGGFGGTGAIHVIDLATATREPVSGTDPAGGLCRVEGGTELGVATDPGVVRTAWSRGVLGCAAQLVGLASRMLELTVGYVRTRNQFGVPIGSFQAVKHKLATAAIQVEFAAPVVANAAFTLSAGGENAERDVSTAKALASDAASAVAATAIQCHGAMGYTTEYDLHRYLKQTWALAREWGSAQWHRARVAEILGLPYGGTVPAH
ncbi:acyl-CoA dehydrogenase family protein [Saccharomonospora sp. NPDC006951]